MSDSAGVPTWQVLTFIVASFAGGGSLASWYHIQTSETTLAFTLRDAHADCNERINQIRHAALQQQIIENDAAARRRDNRAEGVKITTDEPLKFEEETGSNQ